MAVREIRLFGDPILKSETRKVSDLAGARQLVADLLETTSLPGRAGVAATQIGVGLSAFAFNVDGRVGYLINPEITSLEGDPILMDEGCLSLPGMWHKVLRYPVASARGLQLDGSEVELKGTGLMAQALQHEVDHLAGLLYIDRLSQAERKLALKELRQQTWFAASVHRSK